jgi:hypothetical protein
MLLLRLAVSSLSPNASRRIRPSSFTEPAHVSETDFRRPTRGARARVGSLQQKAAGGLTSLHPQIFRRFLAAVRDDIERHLGAIRQAVQAGLLDGLVSQRAQLIRHSQLKFRWYLNR